MPELTLPDTSLYFVEHGTGYPCLVMHGGLGADHSSMYPWMNPLGDTFHLVYYDHRGNGRSGRPDPQSLTFAQLAADADALRQHLGFDQVAVLGLSYGGFIAQEYALRYPHRVSHLILNDTAGKFDYRDEVLFHARRKGATSAMIEALETLSPQSDQEMAEMMKLLAPLYYYDYQPETAERTMGQTVYSGSAARRGFELLEDFDTLSRLPGLKIPTLVLVGRDDYITPPSQAERMHQQLSQSELVVFEQSGHMPHVEEPDLFFGTIRSWFARHTTSPAGQTARG